jgi:hypothetical protein
VIKPEDYARWRATAVGRLTEQLEQGAISASLVTSTREWCWMSPAVTARTQFRRASEARESPVLTAQWRLQSIVVPFKTKRSNHHTWSTLPRLISWGWHLMNCTISFSQKR